VGPFCKLLMTAEIDLSASGGQQVSNGCTFILCGLKTYLGKGKPMPAIPLRK